MIKIRDGHSRCNQNSIFSLGRPGVYPVIYLYGMDALDLIATRATTSGCPNVKKHNVIFDDPVKNKSFTRMREDREENPINGDESFSLCLRGFVWPFSWPSCETDLLRFHHL
jgi:hypothetical protein